MMKLPENNSKKYFKLALLLLLFLQFCLIAHSNLTLLKGHLDTDTGRMFNHIAEIWRRKTLFLPNWDYLSVSTLEWDCSSLFALPIYAITHRLILSYGISNIILTGIFISIIFFLFLEEDSLYPLLCLNLLLIPYRNGMLDYYDMLFFGGAQYIIKVSVPLILVGLLVHMERNASEKQKMSKVLSVFEVLYFVLLFLTSVSSGIYVTASGLFPVFLLYIAYKFFKWEKIPSHIIFLSICSALLILLGRHFNFVIMGGAKGDHMIFCTSPNLWSNMLTCLVGMFELFGGATLEPTAILSPNGLALFAKCCLVLLMLLSGLLSLIKCIKKLSVGLSSRELRTFLLVSVFLWNLLILLLTDTKAGSYTYEYRYHLIGMLPLLCASVSFLIDSMQNLRKIQQNLLYGTGFCTILFVCVMSYKVLYTDDKNHDDLEALCAYVNEYTREYAVDYIYMYQSSRDSELCRVLAEDPSYICLLDNGTTYAYDFYAYYVNAPMQTENVIVVVDSREYDIDDTFEITGHHLKKFDSVNYRNLYYFTD